MDVNDFREIALSFTGAVECSHMGKPDFRVGDRIFATLAHQEQGFGNLMLTPDAQQALISTDCEVFLPAPGGWGRMGATHVRLAAATETQLKEALHTAWKSRLEKNKSLKSRPMPANKKSKPKKA